MNSLSLRQFAIAATLLFAVLSASWLFIIGERKLAHPDEGRYSTIAAEMQASGDYVTPRLNGLKYFEKPPMQYWATAASFALFGKSEWSARLYTALAGLLGVLVIAYAAGRLFTREVGLLTGLVLVACPYYMALAQVVTLDMGLTFWTTLTVAAFLLSQSENVVAARERLLWLLVAAVAAAGAVLSKGLIGIVFPGAVLFLYCLLNHDWRRLARIPWHLAVPAFLAVVVPWFVLVANRNEGFLHFFFVHEHFQRFTTTAHRRVEAWWFFLPILFIGALAWALALLPAVVRGWQARHHALPGHFRPLRFAIIWIVFIVAFFSTSGSKLPAYILPAFPLLAMVVAWYVAVTPGRRLAAYLVPVFLVALAIVWIIPELPARRARNAFELELYRSYAAILMPTFIILAAGIGFAVVLFWRNSKVSRRWGVVVVAVASIFMVERLSAGYETLSPLQSGHALAQSIQSKAAPHARLYAVGTYDQTLPFYLGRSLTLVNYVDEFEMGQKMEPGKHIARLEDFPAAWNAPGPAVAIIPPQHVEKMKTLGIAFEVIHDSPRRVAIMKPSVLPN